jgi:hypothetical protein
MPKKIPNWVIAIIIVAIVVVGLYFYIKDQKRKQLSEIDEQLSQLRSNLWERIGSRATLEEKTETNVKCARFAYVMISISCLFYSIYFMAGHFFCFITALFPYAQKGIEKLVRFFSKKHLSPQYVLLEHDIEALHREIKNLETRKNALLS